MNKQELIKKWKEEIAEQDSIRQSFKEISDRTSFCAYGKQIAIARCIGDVEKLENHSGDLNEIEKDIQKIIDKNFSEKYGKMGAGTWFGKHAATEIYTKYFTEIERYENGN